MAGFQSLVAWRYLMANPRRVGLITLSLTLMSLPLVVLGRFANAMSLRAWSTAWTELLFGAVGYGGIIALLIGGAGCVGAVALAWGRKHVLALCGVALLYGVLLWSVRPLFIPEESLGYVVVGATAILLFFGMLAMCRYWLTFSTTVPLGGVFLGSLALVVVLSVMGGMETDMRSKIVGANGHIRVIAADDLLTDWRSTHEIIKATPGVVASSPYVETEGVIGANRQFTAVVFRGIDPSSIAGVSDLARDLEDPDALRRLNPLADDPNVGGSSDEVQGQDVPAPTPSEVDPAPGDMPSIEPRDYSDEEGEALADAADDDEPAAVPPLTFKLQLNADGTASHVDVPGDVPRGAANDVNDRAARVLDATTLRRADMLPGVLVGRELARTLSLYTGQEVTAVSPLSDPANPDAGGNPIPFHRDFRVAGIFHSGYYEYDAQQIYISVDALQRFLDLGDRIDGFEIRTASVDAAPAVVEKLQSALGAGFRVQSVQEMNKALFSALKIERIGMFLVIGIIMLVASFAIVGNLFMVVVQKSREISLLKTIGATDRSVVRLFITQGLIIGLLGTGSGVLAGLWLCRDIRVLGLRIPAEVYYMDFLPVQIDWSAIGVVLLAGVLISMAATVYPVWLAAQTRPAFGLKRV